MLPPDDQPSESESTAPDTPPPHVDRPVVLIGMMGSGKSSVGRRLSARLGLPFFDADDEIEAAAGLSIREIFERYGEPYFRDGERRVIARLMESGPCVIATGGGAFIQPETRARILKDGIAVWLDVPVPILVERTARRNHRPLLNGKDPAQVLTDLLAVRGADYAKAPLRISSDSTPHVRAVEAIITALRNHTL